MIAGGVIVAEGPPSSLAGREQAATRIRFRAIDGAQPPPIPGVEDTKVADGVLELRTQDPTRVLHELTAWALERNRPLEALEVNRPSLEDVYLDLTGHAQPSPEEDAAAQPAGRRGRRRR